MCMCVCEYTSSESADAGWPHGDPLLHGVGAERHVHSAKFHVRTSETEQAPHPLQAARAPPQRPPRAGRTGWALTRDCTMAWLVAFMQESSGKEHSPSQ